MHSEPIIHVQNHSQMQQDGRLVHQDCGDRIHKVRWQMVQLERQGPGHKRIPALVYRQKVTSEGFNSLAESLGLSILQETNPENSLEGLKLKPKLQYFGHLIRRANSLEKTRMLGKIEGKRSERQRMSWLDSITDSMNLSKLGERVDRGDLHATGHGVTKSRTRLSNSTTTTLAAG